MMLGLMLHITSLIDGGCKELSVQLSGFILLTCQFFGKITSSGLALMIVHRRCTGSFVPNILKKLYNK